MEEMHRMRYVVQDMEIPMPSPGMPLSYAFTQKLPPNLYYGDFYERS